jgi:hypothetical protein
MDNTKREHRLLKREIKRLGSQRRRRQLKRALMERPDDAPYSEFDFGRYSSASLNGIDHDLTRVRRGLERGVGRSSASDQ